MNLVQHKRLVKIPKTLADQPENAGSRAKVLSILLMNF